MIEPIIRIQINSKIRIIISRKVVIIMITTIIAISLIVLGRNTSTSYNNTDRYCSSDCTTTYISARQFSGPWRTTPMRIAWARPVRRSQLDKQPIRPKPSGQQNTPIDVRSPNRELQPPCWKLNKYIKAGHESY